MLLMLLLGANEVLTFGESNVLCIYSCTLRINLIVPTKGPFNCDTEVFNLPGSCREKTSTLVTWSFSGTSLYQ